MKRKGTLWILLGLLLIAAALFLTLGNLHQSRRAGALGEQSLQVLEEVIGEPKEPILPEVLPEEEWPEHLRNPEMEMPVQTIDGVDYIGILEIPALGLKLPVISHWSYPALQMAPCRYGGSAYTGDLIIAAHNYATHFGDLKKLRLGDLLTFTDVEGNVFSYQVLELETLQPTAVEEMTSGDWNLTLFTCTIGGQSRVTVRCIAV